MNRVDSPLNNLKVASPCSQNWNEMYGGDRKRFCGECKLNVYNLSGMTKAEAENLISNTEGRLCVRYYQRADGTVITQDCPVGWARVKQRAALFATAAFSLVFSIFSGLFFVSGFARTKQVVGNLPIPFTTPTPDRPPLMGALAMPNPTPKRKPTPKPTPKSTPEETEIMGDIAPVEPKEKEVIMGKMIINKR